MSSPSLNWYYHRRLHGELGLLPPVEDEARWGTVPALAGGRAPPHTSHQSRTVTLTLTLTVGSNHKPWSFISPHGVLVDLPQAGTYATA